MSTDRAEPSIPCPEAGSCQAEPPARGPDARQDPATARFEDIFCLDDIQRIQDAFAEAADVASLITDPAGRPLTRPSNFTRLCADIIRKTEVGRANCLRSDVCLATGRRDGPTIRHCLSAGLLDGGMAIYVGQRHIASWLVGQVLDESADTQTIENYARVIGADEADFRDALSHVPRMSLARFEKICQALHHFANHLSVLAVANFEQSRLIGELRQAHNRIQDRDRNFAEIIEFLPDPTLVVDGEGRVTFWNKALEKLTGVTAADMLGKGDYAYGAAFYGRPTPLLLDYARGALAHPDPRYQVADIGPREIIAEVTLTALPGGPRHVWAKAVALCDATGAVTGAIEAIRDVTERQQAEIALRRQQSQLEAEVENRTSELRSQALELAEANIRLSELDRLKSAFLSTVSHELRTPLTSILGFAKLIGREFKEHFQPLSGNNEALSARGRRIAQNLAVVYGEAERLTRLINDVLDINRIESGNMQWRDRCINPVAVLGQAAQAINGLVAQRPEISFRFTSDADIPLLLMDPDQLAQVATNLLQNAVKFTAAGEVVMEIRREETGILIVVRDQGLGIPEDQLESIFDRFHQVGRGDTVSNPTNKGTGLGLAICRQIVRHYDGRIWAESQLGAGSAFYVRLPGAAICLGEALPA
ncbi:PAS domain-containing protein [Desulfovibrio aerotolerans]|uniref:histidine kinase n=1 Tax=Solidesulfovibrio aerotolerans TaxID=295255 RepID=A0A7C9IVX6_9BACT|nr:PocR ligand-binding domain-containing protein [Solidesulfovibrio aerotolerans]MYL83102.1 PAS domain-containing protein [Solidesulfovibrio aerotolerans]